MNHGGVMKKKSKCETCELKGYNPDFTSGVFNPGFDFGSYPKPRTFMFGVQLIF